MLLRAEELRLFRCCAAGRLLHGARPAYQHARMLAMHMAHVLEAVCTAAVRCCRCGGRAAALTTCC